MKRAGLSSYSILKQVVFSHPPVKTAAHSKKKGKTLFLLDYLMHLPDASLLG